MPGLLGLLAVALALSAFLSFTLVRVNQRLRLTANPRGDRWHTRATPNSGGVAIFASTAFVYLLAFSGAYPPVAWGAAAMFVLGFLDDRLRLSPLVKFLPQCTVAILVVHEGVFLSATHWTWFNYLFSFLWLVGLTNAFNLIDNMDGLCAGVTIIICGFRVWALGTTGHAVDAGLAALLGSAFLGFLIFNYHPASIFMGDCGSMFVGFSLSALMLVSPEAHTKVFAAAFFYPALTFLYPIFDTLLVATLRRCAGRPISVGGRDHSSHRLVAVGLGERHVVWILWGLTALGAGIGLLIRWLPLEVIAAAALLTAALSMFGIFLSTLPPYQVPQGSPFVRGRLRKYVPTLRAAISLIVDSLLAGTAFSIALLIRYETGISSAQFARLMIMVPLVGICHGTFSCLNRTFDISWQWFAREDLTRIARSVVAGSTLAWICMAVLGTRIGLDAMLMYAVFCFALSAGLRGSVRALQRPRRSPGIVKERVGIFDAGAEGQLLATLVNKHTTLNAKAVLFLDSDPARVGMRVRGLPVRYCDAQLRTLAAEFQFAAVLIAGPFDQERHSAVAKNCGDAGIAIRLLDITVRELNASPGRSSIGGIDQEVIERRER
jgi:UDP-GlcNAc:undecaprenyl-phosphate GlcNAc-1-phosphate transferase